ncbi:MAG: excinuclease ABC subunit UvrC [Spirochaetes bacterium]|nr:excinuclease ABC subunit UvrC [Spirochaetota bacterium]
MNKSIEHKVKHLPSKPGVYIFIDHKKEIIYIGKAVSLKKRVASYFQKNLDAKTRVLVSNINDIDYIVTQSEIEALLLESSLIKKHKPKYNIQQKDDKRFPYIAVTLHEKFPRVIFTRKLFHNGDKYYGPYTDAHAARKTVSLLNKTFKLKTCTKDIPLKQGERPCLNHQIGRCQGVCKGLVTQEEYRNVIETVMQFLEGNIDPVLEKLSVLMHSYSNAMRFESAAQVRDMIFDIQKILQTQHVVTPLGQNQDFIGVATHQDDAYILVFQFRHGSLSGKRIFVYNNASYTDRSSLIAQFMVEYYAHNEPPHTIVITEMIDEGPIVEEYLQSKTLQAVHIVTPKTDHEKAVVQLLKKNLDLAIAQKIAPSWQKALFELQEVLHLPTLPIDIECFDISNIHGAFAVASMVHFTDGMPNKKEYRRYRIRAYTKPDDPGMIHEVVGRRLQHLLNEGLPLPDLLVIDGGKGQLSRALEVMQALECSVPIIALAKRLEEIYLPQGTDPLRLPATSPALKMLQAIRDEAHRFAITYHRTLRNRNITASVLDQISGIGSQYKKKLLQNFETIEQIMQSDATTIATTAGIPQKVAQKIYDFFHRNES